MSPSRPAAVRTITFVGDYPPRQCGIATFTHDIQNAVAHRYPHTDCGVLAVTDPGQTYQYPDVVRFEIEEQEPSSYKRAAEYLNLGNQHVICIQHEFGIYGGASGSYILDFARAAHAPIVTTLHTILEDPTAKQNRVLRELTSLSARVVVMSRRALEILHATYDVPLDKIDLIPHGIPDMPFVDSSYYKDKIGVEGRFVLLTFGLLSPTKGIENVIEALPAILKEFPEVVYLVLGATHPHVLRTAGESYRRSLEKRVEELGIRDSVIFDDRFVEIEELKEYIAAADMYITPYLNPAQITSGTLAYSFGCGKAVISTPYQHAVELLSDDCGVLVPFANPPEISRAVLGLLRDDGCRNAMRKRAYLLGREMIWSEVAARYMETFDKARHTQRMSMTRQTSITTTSESAQSLPPINLDHLCRLTDSTGLIQHARFALPHYPEGYCTDDNARALTLTVALELAGNPILGYRNRELITTYASFLNHAYNPDTGHFRNFMSYDRTWLDKRGSDDSQGRSILALGTCVAANVDTDLRRWAYVLFQVAAPAMLDTGSPRGWASALLGIDAYLLAFSGDRTIRGVADELERRLVDQFESAESSGWHWFETILSYDNALMPQALIQRGQHNRATLNIGLSSLKWLVTQQTSPDGHFRPIGSDGFYPQGEKRAVFDQQPIEAAGMVSASVTAYQATNDPFWLEQARLAFDWFHGRNDVGLSLYDSVTGGCGDGLRVDRVNLNQGAESTLSYLSARIQMEALEKMLLPPARLVHDRNKLLVSVNRSGRTAVMPPIIEPGILAMDVETRSVLAERVAS